MLRPAVYFSFILLFTYSWLPCCDSLVLSAVLISSSHLSNGSVAHLHLAALSSNISLSLPLFLSCYSYVCHHPHQCLDSMGGICYIKYVFLLCSQLLVHGMKSTHHIYQNAMAAIILSIHLKHLRQMKLLDTTATDIHHWHHQNEMLHWTASLCTLFVHNHSQ